MMDSLRKLEILEAQERFRRRALLAARLAECGVYVIGPLGEDAAAPGENDPEAPTSRVGASSAEMLAAAEALAAEAEGPEPVS